MNRILYKYNEQRIFKINEINIINFLVYYRRVAEYGLQSYMAFLAVYKINLPFNSLPGTLVVAALYKIN